MVPFFGKPIVKLLPRASARERACGSRPTRNRGTFRASRSPTVGEGRMVRTGFLASLEIKKKCAGAILAYHAARAAAKHQKDEAARIKSLRAYGTTLV
jgi:hypothetical protein